MKTKKIAAIGILLLSVQASANKFEGIAETPPMGWNSWNTFACDINEELIKDMANVMVSSGMKAVGYEYINIDDCWHGERDNNGFIQVDATRFPSGMKAVADYVHSKGLKLGIYSDAGDKTCGGKPGSNGYEYQDALQYARWGVDYLKYDWCNTENLKAEGAYRTMRDALFSAKRPVVLSICEWGDNKPWLWGEEMGHLWRTTGDIIDCWDCEVDHGTWSSWGIMRILDMQDGLRQYAGPGHWNDPDMMEVGNSMSVNEDRAHFSIWAMLAAPLIAGNDLRTMSVEAKNTLTNSDIIAINQDKLGVQAFKYKVEHEMEYWFKPLADKSWAMMILNRGEKSQKVHFDWKKEDVVDPFFPVEGNKYKTNFINSRFQITDLWNKRSLGTTNKALTVEVASHSVVVYRLDKISNKDKH
ncbi:glycoside hydrolase family 27 protein [Psychrosphaera sp. 1_MG-2023]|uniref:glycoside hydrolase family 27 protein n=1 Tax=Psychrosphaera sp. 1_MG-2023 TaxID=3062643 RepID=UPI0026E23AC4|nr:glycoside hydrolase family 27 protein [Psychrosphaera sp. 1_MG-2023]MDO6717786.1 glycoside hydrolase family 27 protein [Psychrosphaera sp. 1_MG-2023]